MNTPLTISTPDVLYISQARAFWARHCPVCHAKPGEQCDRTFFGEWTAFPVPLIPPWSWWSGPVWVHFHTARQP